MTEETLIRYCAPTLAGMKTGSMFSCPYENRAQLHRNICGLNRRLGVKGLRVVPLRYCEKWVLIYVYRPKQLAVDLIADEAARLLSETGYGNCTANQCVIKLIRRLEQAQGFPHEIGLFLSYPPEDVRGFIEHGGKRCKCVGSWKVYGDAAQAQKTFARYKRCTSAYFSQWQQGVSVERLAV